MKGIGSEVSAGLVMCDPCDRRSRQRCAGPGAHAGADRSDGAPGQNQGKIRVTESRSSH